MINRQKDTDPPWKKIVSMQNFGHFAHGGSIPKKQHEASLNFNTLEITFWWVGEQRLR